MKQLIAGKTGPLKASSAKAVHALMQKRVSEGTVERPDVAASGVVIKKVTVKLNAPKAVAFLQQRKKSLVMG
jgi:hypothetical protein